MEVLSITSIWKLLTWLPKFFLRRVFNKKRMADLILLDVRPRHNYATVDLGEIASYDLWLQIINLSPFEVELDRASIKFICGGVTNKSYILKKDSIGSGEIKDIYISESLADGQANHIARYIDNHQTSIDIDVEFNCKLHPFAKSTGVLSGLFPRFLNEKARLAS